MVSIRFGLLVLASAALAAAQNRPFPQALAFPGCIKPKVDQAAMNKAILDKWTAYKAAYVKPSNGGTPGGGYYVEMRGTGAGSGDKTTSEAHGYGMIFSALLGGAGGDPEAKKYFDGFYNMFDKHRSNADDGLMSWVINQAETSHSGTATDGDMDIAYSLLLAHYQWGSSGSINYLEQAKKTIAGIKKVEMGKSSFRTRLGSFGSNETDTRSSDWMAGHMQAYNKATGDAFWLSAKKTVYDLTAAITASHSSATGLMPDFVVGNPPKPAAPGFLEEDTDGDYSWNACRYPLRIAVDWAHNGTPAAKSAVDKIAAWAKTATAGNPANAKGGYKLNGSALVNYYETAFAAPFIAASIADPANQDYLDKGWALLASDKSDYYGDSIALLAMLIISGNWWSPDDKITTIALPERARGSRFLKGEAPALLFTPDGKTVGAGLRSAGIYLFR
jgi:endo-1,4-beta-D-glucanase Y